MPMTSWEEIAGEKCAMCERPASHFYGWTPLCCQCHGGNIFTAKETAEAHAKILAEKKEVISE